MEQMMTRSKLTTTSTTNSQTLDKVASIEGDHGDHSDSSTSLRKKVPVLKSYGSTGAGGGMPRLSAALDERDEDGNIVEYDNTSDFSSIVDEEEDVDVGEGSKKDHLMYSMRMEPLSNKTTTTCSCTAGMQEDEDEITNSNDNNKGRWRDDYGLLTALKWVFCPCRDG